MDDKKKMVIGISVICIVLFFIALGKDEPVKESERTIQSTNTPKPTATLNPTPTERIVFELLEDDYKSLCREYDYDGIMFTERNLERERAKLQIRFNLKKYFTLSSYSNAFLLDLKEENNLMFNFFEGTVKRSDEEKYPYVGQSIYIMFNEEYGIEPDDYKELDEIIAYGEIVSFNTSTKSGFNECIFIPKYIEKVEKE